MTQNPNEGRALLEALAIDKMFMEIALVVARQSYCRDRQVGAIITKQNSVVGIGFNGTPPGFENECEEDGKTKAIVMHAESNAIAKCAVSTISSEGSTMYCTLSPCVECAKLIIQAKIKRVVYLERWKNAQGLQLLNLAGVETEILEL